MYAHIFYTSSYFNHSVVCSLKSLSQSVSDLIDAVGSHGFHPAASRCRSRRCEASCAVAVSPLLTWHSWHSWPQLSGEASARSKIALLVVGPSLSLVVGLPLVVGLLVRGPPPQVLMEALPVVTLPVGHAGLCTKQSSLAHTSCAETKLLVAPRQSLLSPLCNKCLQSDPSARPSYIMSLISHILDG